MIVVNLLLMAWAALSSPDCGYAGHESEILNTTSLILSRAALEIPVAISELPKEGGSKECVRLEFGISKSGHAEHISISDSTHSFDMNVAAIKALEKYRFKKPVTRKNVRYTLIFRAVMDVAPPPPSSR